MKLYRKSLASAVLTGGLLCDSETQALLSLLADGIATARVLMLVNYALHRDLAAKRQIFGCVVST